jgi:hypothetical protein
LRTHIKSQHGIATVPEKIKPIKCHVETSFSTFVDKGGHGKHTENVHEKPRSPLKPQTTQRSVIEQKKCNDSTVCGKNFESSQDLKKHISFVHEKKKPSPDMSISKIETFDEEMHTVGFD